jgi:hypothetical protein
MALMAGISIGLSLSLMFEVTETAAAPSRQQLIPILGVTMGQDHEPTGTVANLIVSFEERKDHGGLAIHFKPGPGRFSLLAKTAVQQAIFRTAKAAGLSTDTWTIELAVPYPGLTVYGDSLSAMVGLSVVALAKGDFVVPGRVMTGSITPDGSIAPVGSVPLKVEAANEAHMRRVLVPEIVDVTDSDWHTPFLVQVSPVGSIKQAYEALTDHPLR